MLKVAGENLKSNLTRSTGEDLAFEYNLLYFDVSEKKIGIKTGTPQTELDILGETQSYVQSITEQTHAHKWSFQLDANGTVNGKLALFYNGARQYLFGDNGTFNAGYVSVSQDITATNNLYTGGNAFVGKGVFSNDIQVGVTAPTQIDTATNDLTLTSATGNVNITGSLFVNGVKIDNNVTHVGAAPPESAIEGDMWLSTNNAALYIYAGGAWMQPSYAGTQGLSTSMVPPTTSDDRLKTKLGTVTHVLDKMLNIPVFKYNPNDLAKSLGIKDKGTEYGMSAQELQQEFPDLVRLSEIDEDSNGESKSGEKYLTIDYARMTTILWQAVKELSKKVENLEKIVR